MSTGVSTTQATETTPAPGAPRTILGCMGWGGGWGTGPLDEAAWRAAEDAAREALEAALGAGITVLDTADIYAHGRSEETLGRLLAADPGLRERIRIQTKCGILLGGSPLYDRAHGAGSTRYDSSAAHVRSAVAGSLRRLGTDHVDTLVIHRPDVLTDPAETVGAFLALQSAGAVGSLGVSNMGLAWVRRFDDALREATGGAQGLACVQLELGLHARTLIESVVLANHPGAPASADTEGIAEFCAERGIAIQAWGALGQGRYTRPHPEPADAAAAAEVGRVAGELGVAPEAVVLAWLLRLPWGVRPVVGSTRPGRIAASAGADGVAERMDAGQWYRIWTAARGESLP
ncbi:aldo/keto reductase [Citricoccus sp. SGAir0253]|uniref:aldo/keto reductase n=1 Tax=Citricoccus sp. SGAir0253 TaxID=2567881 RepID=UPI0010CCBF5C|nr:aldo/keto reductase [Citricoccus sp. SGAir0253]QCU78795.1 aldo/keto reductase [Citricoccus sp. SGAir0253]